MAPASALWGAPARAGVRSREACALGALYLLGRGQERACPAAARAAGQSGRRPGAATRARSSPAGHSWIPDKGWGGGAGRGERGSVCFLPAGSVPATLGSSKSPTRRDEPRLAPGCAPDASLGSSFLAPVQSRSWSLEGLCAAQGGRSSVCDPRENGRRQGALAPNLRAGGGTGARCPGARRGQVSPCPLLCGPGLTAPLHSGRGPGGYPGGCPCHLGTFAWGCPEMTPQTSQTPLLPPLPS